VDTLGTYCDSNVNSIIDEEWHSVSFGDGMDLLGRPNQIGRVACLLTVLDDGDTWLL
jgi:hypothetical protein